MPAHWGACASHSCRRSDATPARRGLTVDLVEKADELLMPVPRHTLADDPALDHVECGEQGRRTVTLIIVGHRATAASLHRQPRLGAVERLDLRLLVNRQHQRVLGWINVEADNIPHLGGKLR